MNPTRIPTTEPSVRPSASPSVMPTQKPTGVPSKAPTGFATIVGYTITQVSGILLLSVSLFFNHFICA
jgi:hypothetical protein